MDKSSGCQLEGPVTGAALAASERGPARLQLELSINGQLHLQFKLPLNLDTYPSLTLRGGCPGLIIAS